MGGMACGAGAAVGVGFCGGFCAKVGETEPAARIPTRKAASRVRAVSRNVYLAKESSGLKITSRENGLRMPPRVFMTMIAPRNPAPKRTVLFTSAQCGTCPRHALLH